MKKLWKEIELGSCVYAISNYGDVFNVTRNKKQNLFLAGHGYWTLTTQKNKIKKNYSVHRLVGLLFIPNPLNKETINHKNGNKLDNRVENLEWVSYSENNIHAIQNGLKTFETISKKVAQIKNGVIINIFKSGIEASKKTGIDRSSIYDCARQKPHCKTAGGFEWKYL